MKKILLGLMVLLPLTTLGTLAAEESAVVEGLQSPQATATEKATAIQGIQPAEEALPAAAPTTAPVAEPAGTASTDLTSLFEQSKNLSSDYIMATYSYANSLLGLDQKALQDNFSWSVTTGNLTYYWNDGDTPGGAAAQGSTDIKAQTLSAGPSATFTIPTSGTEITVASPFTVDLNTTENSTVSPSVEVKQEIIGVQSYDNLITALENQKTLLSAESSLTKAELNLENSVLDAIAELFDAKLAYAKAEKSLSDAELNMTNVATVLGYTEESTTYQESVMALLQAEQALSNARYELTKAEDDLELLTGVRTLTFEELNLAEPTLTLDDLRATTALMSAELDLSIAENTVKQANAEDTFSLDGTFGGNMTVGNSGITNSNLSAGLQASVNDGLSFGMSVGTNLNKKDLTAGVNFTYVPQAYEASTISAQTIQNQLLLTMEQKSMVESLYTSQQAQLKNQIDLWQTSYDIALRRYEVAKSQYDHGISLFEQGYSSQQEVQEKELTLLDAENGVLQSLMNGLQLERSIELFYNS